MKPSAIALTAFDAVLGALMGPANLWLMSQLVRTERAREWLASALPWARPADPGAFWSLFAAPSALGTAIAAPLLFRYLQGLKVRSVGQYFRRGALAGIVCGLWVTSLAVFITLIWLTRVAGSGAIDRSVDGTVVAILTALAFGPMIALLCLPAIVLSGSLFGLINALLIRRDVPASRGA